MDDARQSFTATVVTNERRRVLIPLPFDPDATWGPKPAITWRAR